MSVHVQTWLNSNNDKVGHWYTNEVITSRVGQFTWAIIAVTHFCCVSHETTGHSTNSKCKRPRRERNATTTERRKQFVELGELGIPTTEHRKELKVVESNCSPWRPLISFSTKNRCDSSIQTIMALFQRGREERGINEKKNHRNVTTLDGTL